MERPERERIVGELARAFGAATDVTPAPVSHCMCCSLRWNSRLPDGCHLRARWRRGRTGPLLIDTPLTSTDAARVADRVRATGKNITTVYITHGHGDHFFGLGILDAFTAPGPSPQRQPSPTSGPPPPS